MRRSTAIDLGVAVVLALAALFLFPSRGPIPASDEPPSDAPDESVPAMVDAPETPPPGSAAGEDAEAPAPPAAVPAKAARPERRPLVVEGRVVGLRGEPVPGATVLLLRFPVRRPEPLLRSVDPVFDLAGPNQVKTGDDGAFRFETSPVPCAGLLAWGAGHANTFLSGFVLEEDLRGVVLRLEPAAALAGRVLSVPGPDGGGPIPGVRVTLLQRGPTDRWIALRTETTDAEGRFSTWGWAPGRYALLVEKEGLRSLWLPDVPVPDAALEIRLSPATTATLEGEVFLPDGRSPAANAAVTAVSQVPLRAGQSAEAQARTDAEGKFRIEALEVASATASNFVKVQVDAGPNGIGASIVHLVPPAGRAMVFLVPVGDGVLRGRLDAGGARGAGASLEGVVLQFRAGIPNPADRNAPITVEREAVTGPDGSFEVRGLPGRTAGVSLAPGEVRWELARSSSFWVPERPAEGPWEVVIDVVPRARITGKVVGPDGEPMAAARVTDEAGLPPRGAVTGADGRFTLDGIPTLRRRGVRLRVEAAGFAPTFTESLSLEPGSRYEGLLVTLGARLAIVTGRVVDETGKGVAGAEVSVVPSRPEAFLGAGIRPTVTGPDGTYRLEVPAGAEIRVRANARRVRFAESEVLLAGDPVPELLLGRESYTGPK